MRPPLALFTILSTAALLPNFFGNWIGGEVLHVAGAATKTTITAKASHIGLGAASFDGVRIMDAKGEPIAEVPTLDVRYNLRDLLPGSTHLFGLEGVTLTQPRITIIRHRDGSFNLPALGAGKTGNRKGAPFNLTASVRNGSVTFIDRSRVNRSAQRIVLDRLNAHAAIDTAASTRYRVSLAYEWNGRGYPIRGFGNIDKPAAFSYQHWTAAKLPIAQFVAYGANSTTLSAQSGTVNGLDARLFGLPGPHGVEHRRLLARATLTGAAIRASALAQPIRDLHGSFTAGETGLTTNGISGTIGRIPLRIRGSITNLRRPQLDLISNGVVALADLRSVFPAAAHLALSGNLRYALRIGGTAKAPLALIALSSPLVTYGTTAVQAPRALLAYAGGAVTAFDASAAASGASLFAQAHASLKRHARGLEALASIDGPALGGAAVHAGVAAQGSALTRVALAASGTTAYGDFRAAGFYRNGTAALRGRLRGSITGPIALVSSGGETVAQIGAAQLHGLAIRGIPLRNVAATVALRGKTVKIDAARADVAGGTIAAEGHESTTGMRLNVTATHLNLASLGAASPVHRGDVSVAAQVGGTLKAPTANGALVLSHAAYRSYPIDAQGAFGYGGGALALHDATVGLGPALVHVGGTVSGIALGRPMVPRYDLDARVRAAQAGALIAMVNPSFERREALAAVVDANAHVGGSGRAPRISGTVAIPEGSVHGLGFDNVSARFAGTTNDYRLSNGRATIGSTRASFAGSLVRHAVRASVSAPRANLADFDDYFDTADTLAGRGRLALSFASSPSGLKTSGTVALLRVRYRRFALGTADARWYTANRRVTTDAVVGGPHGIVALNGSVLLPRGGWTSHLLAAADVALRASVRHFDLATWLPMAGIQTPVAGTLDGGASVNGRYPNLAIAAHASLLHGFYRHIPIETAQIALRARNGRGRITRAVFRIPYLAASGDGTFGMRPADPFDLAMRVVSPDLGGLQRTMTGKATTLAGALDTTVRLTGTRTNPAIADGLRIIDLRYGRFLVPSITASVSATRAQVRLDDATIAFASGAIHAHGRLPIRLKPPGLAPPSAPVALTITADRVALSNFATALPPGSSLSGLIDGTIAAGGTVANPAFAGTMTLANGSFSGPIETVPIDHMNAVLALSAKQIALRRFTADAGGGTIAAAGALNMPSLHDLRAATGSLAIRMNAARFNSPKYFSGTVDANVRVARAANAIPSIAGTVDVPRARIPVTAFYNPRAPAGPKRVLPDVALNIRAAAGNDVRVQSSAVDVGAMGSVVVGGTLQAPTLSGVVRSTGGTVNFLRDFTIARAVMHFAPSDGIMPRINALATTYVPKSDTSVNIHVTGLAPNQMHVAFASNPSYDRSQILGILAGVQTPGVPSAGTVSSPTASSELQTLAMGQLDTVFTRNLFEPLSAQIGSALGLTDFSVNDSLQGGLGLNAAKAFGRNLTASFSESLAPPVRQTFSVEAHAARGAGVRLTVYTQQEPPLTAYQPTVTGLALNTVGSQVLMQPFMGTNGFSLTYLHEWM